MDGNELRPVWKGRLDLNFVHHLGHTFHHVASLQDRRAVAHEIGHAASVASPFKNFKVKNGDTLGVVEFQAALLPATRQVSTERLADSSRANMMIVRIAHASAENANTR